MGTILRYGLCVTMFFFIASAIGGENMPDSTSTVINSKIDTVAVKSTIAQFKKFGEKPVEDMNIISKLFETTRVVANAINAVNNERYAFTIVREEKNYYTCVYSNPADEKKPSNGTYQVTFDDQIQFKINKISFKIEGVTFGG